MRPAAGVGEHRDLGGRRLRRRTPKADQGRIARRLTTECRCLRAHVFEGRSRSRLELLRQRLYGGSGRDAVQEGAAPASRKLAGGARPGATARCITSRPAGAANSGGRDRSGRHRAAKSVGLHERRMPATGFGTGIAAGRDAMREHRTGSPRREPVGATGQGPDEASASDALPAVPLPDAPEIRTAGLPARPGVAVSALERDLADDAMRQQSPRPTCEKDDGPHTPRAVSRWLPRLPPGALSRTAGTVSRIAFSPRQSTTRPSNHSGQVSVPPSPLATIQDGTSESVQFRHWVALEASLQHDAVFVQHVADGAFRTLQAKHQIAV